MTSLLTYCSNSCQVAIIDQTNFTQTPDNEQVCRIVRLTALIGLTIMTLFDINLQRVRFAIFNLAEGRLVIDVRRACELYLIFIVTIFSLGALIANEQEPHRVSYDLNDCMVKCIQSGGIKFEPAIAS